MSEEILPHVTVAKWMVHTSYQRYDWPPLHPMYVVNHSHNPPSHIRFRFWCFIRAEQPHPCFHRRSNVASTYNGIGAVRSHADDCEREAHIVRSRTCHGKNTDCKNQPSYPSEASKATRQLLKEISL